MIVDKLGLYDQGNLSLNCVKWAIESNTTLAYLTRPLTVNPEYVKELGRLQQELMTQTMEEGNDLPFHDFSSMHMYVGVKQYVDDITEEEVNKCTDMIVNLCLDLNELDLLKQYLTIALTGDKLLKKLKEVKLITINKHYEEIILSVQKEHIPVTEMLSFETQERESLAYKASNYKDESVCPTMKAIATARNKNLKELCDKALQKASTYRNAIGVLIGKRQLLQDKVGLATSVEELDTILWSE